MITDDTKHQSLRAEYEANLEGQLDKVDAKIRELGILSHRLDAKFHAAQAALRHLIEAPDDHWVDLREKVDDLFFDLNKALDEASPQSD
jgi:hypothetical protein